MIYQIKGKFPTLNEHDNANRRNKFMGAKMKHQATDTVATQLLGCTKIEHPCHIAFTWRYSSRADFDNIRFACKYVLDGMIKAGVLPNDNQKWVLGFKGDYFEKVPKGEEGVVVETTSSGASEG